MERLTTLAAIKTGVAKVERCSTIESQVNGESNVLEPQEDNRNDEPVIPAK